MHQKSHSLENRLNLDSCFFNLQWCTLELIELQIDGLETEFLIAQVQKLNSDVIGFSLWRSWSCIKEAKKALLDDRGVL